MDPMLSTDSRDTLMSYTDHSMQRRFKSNAPYGRKASAALIGAGGRVGGV